MLPIGTRSQALRGRRLIDMEHFVAAIGEMNRVRAGGGWQRDKCGRAAYFKIDDYLTERSDWERWRGIEVKNWHRPLRAYMQAFLAQRLTLTFFDEPAPKDKGGSRADKYRRVPWYMVMEWRKPKG